MVRFFIYFFLFFGVALINIVYAVPPDVNFYKQMISIALEENMKLYLQSLDSPGSSIVVIDPGGLTAALSGGAQGTRIGFIQFISTNSKVRSLPELYNLGRILNRFEADHPGVPMLLQIPEKFTVRTFYSKLITGVPSKMKHSVLVKMCARGNKRISLISIASKVGVVGGVSLAIDAAVSKKVAADYPDWAKHKAPPSARKGIGNHAGAGP